MLRQLIILAGPTAVGKTTTAIHIAKQLKGEIISADSRQLYRFMDIATAKPAGPETAAVAHHGLDLKNPDEPYSAGEFSRFARNVVRDIWNRGKVPVIAGGTGLYIQALLDGLGPEPHASVPMRRRLQERLRTEGLGRLYDELGQLDPVAQSQVRASDTQRVLRALELAGGIGSHPTGGWDPMPVLAAAFCLCRPREELNQRIDTRVELMVSQGLVAEAQNLVRLGYNRDTRAMQSLGYEELLDHLEAKCTLDQALERIRIRTRQFAKRQVTWFRRDRRFRWLDLSRWGLGGTAERVYMEMRNRERFLGVDTKR